MYIFEASWPLDVDDGLDLLLVHLNASVRDNEAKEFSGWYAKNALGRIQLHLVFPEVIEGFLEVADEVVSFPGHHRDVVNVGVHVPTNLIMEAPLHHTLVGGTCVFSNQRAW